MVVDAFYLSPYYHPKEQVMAINIRCIHCKIDFKIDVKKCSHCGCPLTGRNKVYRVVLWNGKRVIRTVPNLELAREVEAKLKIDIIREGNDLKKKKPAPTLDEVWERYLPWVKTEKKSWNTDNSYYTKHLKPLFGNKPLDKISTEDIEKMKTSMKKKRFCKKGRLYSLATIKHQIVLLSRLYTIAEDWGMYNGLNPCRKVKRPKLNNTITEFLTHDELSRLMKVLADWPDSMAACCVLFSILTGIRKGEQFRLQWNDIDFDRQKMTLKDPKGVLDQLLPLSKEALGVLEIVPHDFDTPWIFYGTHGQQMKDLRKRWYRIREAARLPQNFRWHGLRHHFASTLASNGVGLNIIQKLLTHKCITMTDRYAHLSDNTLRDAANLSGELMNPKNL